MRKFKHKKLNLIASNEFNRCSDGYYQIENDEIVRESIIEDSNDWEEIKPLFVTADGKEIFEGDKYFTVRLDTLEILKPYANWVSDKKWLKYFSTREAANKYIEQNKPRFSVKDIEEALNKNSTVWIGEIAWTNVKEFKQKLGI